MLKLVIIAILSLNVFADCNISIFDKTPVLADGRVKPLYVHAKESIKFMSGKTSYNNQSSSEIYCQMILTSLGLQNKKIELPILVEHLEAKELLKLDKDKTLFNADTLMTQHDFIRAKVVQMKESTPLKKELTKVWSRLNIYKKIQDKDHFTLAKSNNNELAWNSLKDIEINDIQSFYQLLTTSTEEYISIAGDNYQLELTLYKSHVFSIAMIFVLLAIFLTVLLKNNKFGISMALIAIIIEIVGITLRVLVSGRAPITNMYETVMFSGFGALVISLFIMFYKKDKYFLLSGLGYNLLCLFMMKFANNMLDESISPLVPVLRDNFWLSTHVTTIILSYAALALSWILANIVLVKSMRGSIIKSEQRYYENLINTCVVVGVTLLSAGIILGGVWADYSWGRFWGWDPKETWSLIVFLFYITLLHGRYTNWLNPKRYILSVAGGFMTVMMAWFGVNYILATGLHSYGFSEGGAIFLGSFFLIQTSFLVLASWKFSSNNQSLKNA
jgi:cytochrome c-type biogenesis protein CcsB